MKIILISIFTLCLVLPVFSQNGSWWEPANPSPGDTITIFFDPTINPDIPPNPAHLTLHWGVNEISGGSWQIPPNHLWPPGTVIFGSNEAVRSPMAVQSGSVWAIRIPTDSTIFTIHYVVNDGTPQTTGSNWAHSTGGSNWNITLAVVEHKTYPYTFLLDKRSYYMDFIDPVTFASVRGTFNNWGGLGEDTLLATNNPDVLGRRVELPANSDIMYKFYLNGARWIWDPDNPLTNSGSNNNSVLYFIPDSQGYFYDLTPQQGDLLSSGSTINFQARVQPGITFSGIDPATIRVTLDASTVSHSFDPITGLITGSLSGISDGGHLLSIQGEDSLGVLFKTSTIHFGVYGTMPEGIVSLDPVGDNTGSGSYLPPPFATGGDADLTDFSLQVNATHDSLLFSIGLDEISDYTRVGFYLMNSTSGVMVDALNEVNLQIREWNGGGVYVSLADPSSPNLDPAVENHLITSRQPVQTGMAIQLDAGALAGDRFEFSLPLAELEQYLGSFNSDWYVTAYTYYKDAGGTVTVTPAMGGDSTGRNSNVYDVLFCDYILDVPLQQRMLANFNNLHLSWLDAEGRGFLKFSPGDLDPNWTSFPPRVAISTRTASTIMETKQVRGTVSDTSVAEVTVSRNGWDTTAVVTDGSWQLDLPLDEADNLIRASATNSGGTGYSGTLVVNRWVDHNPQPDIAFSYVSGTVTLDAGVSTDPDNDIVSYHWEVDPNNPETVTLSNPGQQVVSFPKPQADGEYYFNLVLTDAQNHTGFKRTFVRVADTTANIFQSDQSADWLQDVVLYEIFIRSFSPEGNFQGVINKLDYMQWLGINCIWFVPINESPDDHGYSVQDYYSIESDYGTFADFQNLVEQAHARGIRVIIDHVVNHSSLYHVFAQDMVAYQKDSQYWNFYEHRRIGDTNGLGYGSYPSSPPYIYTYYSNWSGLPNLNLGHPDARKYFIDMAKWWVDSMKVDGYRCDVAWGPINRGYNYWEDWRKALKNLKPETFLLGELDASDWNYAFTNRFDVAHDWQLHHGSGGYRDIWNSLDLNQLHNRVTNYGYGWPQYKYPLRFLENFDEGRYISDFGVERTKVIAALNMTIPGIPLIYAGQEVGEMSQRGLIDWSDPNHFLMFYRNLVQARRRFPALRRGDFNRIGVINFSHVYGISRQKDENIVIALFNFQNGAQTGNFAITASQYGLDPGATYYLSDILSGEVIQTTGSGLGFQQVSLDPYQSKIFVLADSIVTGVGNEEPFPGKKLTYQLAQNYPNPFNPTTTISFQIPKAQKVQLLVYNVLGQKVTTLLDKSMSAGDYQVKWDGRNESGVPVSSGIYILHFKAGDFVRNKRMVLLK